MPELPPQPEPAAPPAEAPKPRKKLGRKPAWDEPTAMLSARMPARIINAARARARATGRRFCRFVADALQTAADGTQ